MMAGLPDAGAVAAAILGGRLADGHPGRLDIGDVLHSALSMGVAGPGHDGSTTALTDLQTSLHHAPANAQPTGIQLATQHSTGAGAPVDGKVPLHEVHTQSVTREVVDASVNGGPKVPMVIDTGSNGAVIPITDIGLQHLGLPTGFHQTSYGSSLGGAKRKAY